MTSNANTVVAETTAQVGSGDAVAVRTVALTKIYPNGRGIRDINFTVQHGEIFGLLGPNGAGKTTTIRTLLDFLRPTSGHAFLLGADAHASPSARHRVGFLPGDLSLSVRATARDWLNFQAELREGVDTAYMKEVAETVEADLDEPLHNLSSGNRQKIGIVNALMHRPDLVVMDEPTAGLDPLIRRRVYSLLSDVRKRDGAVLLSSHVLPEVERVCDRVAIIRRGELVAVDTMAQLKAKAVRHLEIVFAGHPPIDQLRKIPGVLSAEGENSIVRVAVSGSVAALIRALAQYEVIDLASGSQALEDQFMSFYDGGSKDELS